MRLLGMGKKSHRHGSMEVSDNEEPMAHEDPTEVVDDASVQREEDSSMNDVVQAFFWIAAFSDQLYAFHLFHQRA